MGTWILRPNTHYLNNAVFATSFTKNSREMILMDAAAEAGHNAANTILISHGLKTLPNLQPNTRSHGGLIFWILRLIDQILFRYGFKHLSSWTGGYTWIIIFIFILILFSLICYILTKIYYYMEISR